MPTATVRIWKGILDILKRDWGCINCKRGKSGNDFENVLHRSFKNITRYLFCCLNKSLCVRAIQ